MITKQDLSLIISEAYARASLREDCDMRIVADLFEIVRMQLNISNPYKSWDFIILDKTKFNYDFCVELLNDLQESYYNLFFEKQLTQLSAVYESDKSEALSLWIQFYAEAAIYFREDMLCMLCCQRQKWEKKSKELAKYSKFPKLLQESRWPDTYPFYSEIAENISLSSEVRAYSEITLFQIVLYYYPEYSRALKHLENATLLLPDHIIIKRGWAEYYLKTGETNKARDGFLQVLALKPGDYISLNYIGDCFLTDAKLENAESWYNDAIQKNLLQTDSYKRLLNLYSNKSWFKEKEHLFESLLFEIKKRQKYHSSNQLIQKKLATEECFKDLQLFESYRDVGAAWFSNQNFEKSEEWYSRAGNLNPEVTTVIIDIAYLKFHQELPDKAKELFLQVLETEKDNFDAYYGLAYYYDKKDNKEDAILNYQTCLRLRPHWNDTINNLIGNLHYSGGEYKEAASYYSKAVEANDNYPVYRKNLAGAFQELAEQFVKAVNYSEAEKFYLQAVNTDTTSDRWNELGVFYHNQNRWKEAIACYDKAIALENSNSLFYENLGLAYEALDQFAEAEHAYKQAIEYDSKSGRYLDRLGVFYFVRKDFNKSIDYYQMALEREPEEPVYYENIALSYEKKEMYPEAVENYEKALKYNPANAKNLNAIGLIYYNQQQYKPAIEYYRKALVLDSNNWIYLSNLGLALSLSGSKDEAIDVFQKAVRLKDDDNINWNALGILYYEKGEQDKAIECYKKSISIQPNDPVHYENIALAYEKKEMYSEAAENYEKALKLNPENVRVLNAMGLLYYNQHKYEPAIDFYRKALLLDSNNWIYLSNLGLALNLSGNKDEAIDVFQKALKIKDDDYINWNLLGILFYEKGEMDNAIDCYHKAIRIQADDPVLYINLALALNIQGKNEEVLNITDNYSMKPEVRKEVESMLKRDFPILFETKS